MLGNLGTLYANLIVRYGGVEIPVAADEDGGGSVVQLFCGEPRVVEGEVASPEDGVNAVSKLLGYPSLLGGPVNIQWSCVGCI